MNTCKYVKSSEKELSDTTFMAINETDMQYIKHKTFGMTLTESPLLIAALRPCAKLKP